MKANIYIKLSKEQIDKVGNAIVYLLNALNDLSKTKILKLLYILDELSIKKSGIPFFNLKYKVWKFGPVSEEIFIDLSSETTLLKKYIKRTHTSKGSFIKPITAFSDDEFSDNDIDLMDYVIKEFGSKTAKDLVSFTHRTNSPWYITAKDNLVLELLENEIINNTELLIDLGMLVEHDERKKAIYNNYLEYN